MLTAKQFIAKFPNTKPNENCLRDMACPKCGNRESFKVEAVTEVRLEDDGTDDIWNAGYHWDDNSLCRCVECDYCCVISELTVEGLDNLLEERGQNNKRTSE